ncbi:MAG TPA: L,D-transpeptidase family protein [Sphingomonas sp.]|nr:L,D-transpeptidase family protein [Sphingomonas sp.]
MPKSVLTALGLLCSSVALASAAPVQQQGDSGPQIDMGILHVQVILDHLGFSPGVLDGQTGMSFKAALRGFQESRGLKKTGEIDRPTLAALQRYRAWTPTKTLALTRQALAGPFIRHIPRDEMKQAKLPGLYYRSRMEKLAEMFHTTPEVLLALNSPQTMLAPGSKVVFPNALPLSRDYDPSLPADWRKTLNMLNADAHAPEAAKIVVDKSESVLKVYDKADRLVAQFQVTTGSTHDPLPLGHWKINGPDYNPKFAYNPDLFWDSKSSDSKALLPPGPNGPVGVVWLDLSKEHYGIHGTPEPQLIGRTASHGCVRLTNWNAARLSLMVKPGTPVVFQA